MQFGPVRESQVVTELQVQQFLIVYLVVRGRHSLLHGLRETGWGQLLQWRRERQDELGVRVAVSQRPLLLFPASLPEEPPEPAMSHRSARIMRNYSHFIYSISIFQSILVVTCRTRLS